MYCLLVLLNVVSASGDVGYFWCRQPSPVDIIVRVLLLLFLFVVVSVCLFVFVLCNRPYALKEKWHREEHIVIFIIGHIVECGPYSIFCQAPSPTSITVSQTFAGSDHHVGPLE